jgi:hypothetical protein
MQLRADIEELAEDRCIVHDFSRWFGFIDEALSELMKKEAGK